MQTGWRSKIFLGGRLEPWVFICSLVFHHLDMPHSDGEARYGDKWFNRRQHPGMDWDCTLSPRLASPDSSSSRREQTSLGTTLKIAQSTGEVKLVLSKTGKPYQHLMKMSPSQANGRVFYEILSVVISVSTVSYLPAFLYELTSCRCMLLPDVQWDVPFSWLIGMLLGPMNWHGPLQKGPPLGCEWYVIWLLRG